MAKDLLQFFGMLLGLAVLFLCVRFPHEISAKVRKLLGANNELDPLALHIQGEFVESNLGTAQEADGSVTVRAIAEQYNFVPACILVPVGVPVRFRMTSADLVHRFAILGTPDELEVVPGHVTEQTLRFNVPGEHITPCNEFCGPGHWDMRSRIRVVADFPKIGTQERVNCDRR
jgi:cytochrome c oxidase subunit II